MKYTYKQKKLIIEYAKRLVEARDNTYASYTVKKDKIIAQVTEQRAATFTKLAKSWKELDKKVTLLEDKKRELNELKNQISAETDAQKEKIRAKVIDLFDDSESAMSLTVECLNSTFTVSKITDENIPKKTSSAGDIISTDYKKVIELLLEQNEDLKSTVDALIKQCSVLAVEDIWKPGDKRRTSVKPSDDIMKSEGMINEGIWNKVVSFIDKMKLKVKQYFTRLESRQQKINQQLILLKSN